MKVFVAGAGNVGSYLALDLLDGGHEVLAIERDPAVVESLPERSGARWVVGDACELATLAEVGLETFDVAVAATGDDEDNLVVSLLAKQEFAVPRVVARVNHPRNHWLFTEAWGVDFPVSTPHLLSALVEEAVAVGALVRIMQIGDTRLDEVTLAEDSPAAGKTIAELGLPREASVVAIVRRDRSVVVPRGDTLMEAGDEVMALVQPEAEEEVRRLLVGG